MRLSIIKGNSFAVPADLICFRRQNYNILRAKVRQVIENVNIKWRFFPEAAGVIFLVAIRLMVRARLNGFAQIFRDILLKLTGRSADI